MASNKQALTQSQLRAWLQPNGPGPTNPVYFAGVGYDDIQITGGSKNLRGSRDPINRHDPRRPGKYRRLGQRVSPPDNNSVTVEFSEYCGGIPAHDLLQCDFNLYEFNSCCGDPGDFLRGWDGRIKVYSNIDVESGDYGDRTAFDGQSDVMTSYSAEVEDIYDVGELNIGVPTGFAATATKTIVGTAYGNNDNCGNCGPNAKCDSWLYAVDNAGIIYYRTSNGTGTLDITAANLTTNGLTAGTELPVGLTVVSGSLVVLFSNAAGNDGYMYASIETSGGLPTADASWSKVYPWAVATVNPSKILESDVELLIAGFDTVNATYPALYRISAPGETIEKIYQGSAAGTINAVASLGDLYVIALANGTLVYSRNNGLAWSTATITGAPVPNAIHISGEYLWWVATASGLMYSIDQGANWATKTIAGMTGTIYDVMFVSDEVGYAIQSTGAIAMTWNGGYSWTTLSPRIATLQVTDLANPKFARIDCVNKTRQTNTLAIGGASASGSVIEARLS